MNNFKTLAVALLLTTYGSMAPAATFDFGLLADSEKSKYGHENYFRDVRPNGMTVDDITVTTSDNAWLDGSFNARGFFSPAAGIGGCSRRLGCDANDTDGIREPGEVVSIFFSQLVDATWTFRETPPSFYEGTSGDHTLTQGCVMVNGQRYGTSEGQLGFSIRDSRFDFENCGERGGSRPYSSDFYVTSVDAEVAPIPLPAAGLMLLAAIGGLFGYRRFA